MSVWVNNESRSKKNHVWLQTHTWLVDVATSGVNCSTNILFFYLSLNVTLNILTLINADVYFSWCNFINLWRTFGLYLLIHGLIFDVSQPVGANPALGQIEGKLFSVGWIEAGQPWDKRWWMGWEVGGSFKWQIHKLPNINHILIATSQTRRQGVTAGKLNFEGNNGI